MCYSAENDIQVVRQQRDEWRKRAEEAEAWKAKPTRVCEACGRTIGLVIGDHTMKGGGLACPGAHVNSDWEERALIAESRAETAERDAYARGIREAAKLCENAGQWYIPDGTSVSGGMPYDLQMAVHLAGQIRALLPTDTAAKEEETEPSRRWLNTVGKHPEGSAVHRILEAGAKIREEEEK